MKIDLFMKGLPSINPSLRRVLGLLLLAYPLLVFGQLLHDPLVLAPQLDAGENFLLAEQFAKGSLPEEPFYRSPLYPWLLSLFPIQESIPLAAALLGIACHFLNGFLLKELAHRLFKVEASGWLVAFLYLWNPVLLFYAPLLLDITPAISLFLGSLFLTFRSNPKHLIASGVLMALAALMRPHFLPAALFLPFVIGLRHGSLRPTWFLPWAPLLAGFLAFGLVNTFHAGEFRILPWQGSYNLWTANKPSANGLYFQQSLDVSDRQGYGNPAREESIRLYRQAVPESGNPPSISEMNEFWRDKWLSHMVENPLAQAGLWIFKAYAVLNTREQYNNYTFAFHRERYALLRWNPIHFGMMLLLGVGGGIAAGSLRPRFTAALLLLFAAYASTLILFYASARFRLPLLPGLCLLAGAIPCILAKPSTWLVKTPRILLPLSLAAVLTYSSLGDIDNPKTEIQDTLLLAQASAGLGRDYVAASWARKALRMDEGRRTAHQIFAASYFNLRLEANPRWKAFGDWESQVSLVDPDKLHPEKMAALRGIYHWKADERKEALKLWNHSHRTNPGGLGSYCLAANGAAPHADLQEPLLRRIRTILATSN